jgi:hypothetical protein
MTADHRLLTAAIVADLRREARVQAERPSIADDASMRHGVLLPFERAVEVVRETLRGFDGD